MILEGIRVLDFTQYLAGPTVTRLMAEMGADIIKIERGPAGDPSRSLPAVKDGRSGYFVQQNLGKRSVCLDMDHAETDAIVRDLVRLTTPDRYWVCFDGPVDAIWIAVFKSAVL